MGNLTSEELQSLIANGVADGSKSASTWFKIASALAVLSFTLVMFWVTEMRNDYKNQHKIQIQILETQASLKEKSVSIENRMGNIERVVFDK